MSPLVVEAALLQSAPLRSCSSAFDFASTCLLPPLCSVALLTSYSVVLPISLPALLPLCSVALLIPLLCAPDLAPLVAPTCPISQCSATCLPLHPPTCCTPAFCSLRSSQPLVCSLQPDNTLFLFVLASDLSAPASLRNLPTLYMAALSLQVFSSYLIRFLGLINLWFHLLLWGRLLLEIQCSNSSLHAHFKSERQVVGHHPIL